jgi:hypothetical protein
MTGIAVEYLQGVGQTLTLYMNNNDMRKKFSEEVTPVSSLTHGRSFSCMLWT